MEIRDLANTADTVESRRVPNDLVEKGLLEKSELDKRTNVYTVTSAVRVK